MNENYRNAPQILDVARFIIKKNDIYEEFFNLLDVGFFKVRYERCSDGEKKFVFAMVSCEE